jgi:hypothetical protein
MNNIVNAFTILVLLLMIGCECDYDRDLYARFENFNNVSVEVEFRIIEGKNTDGSTHYKLFKEKLSHNEKKAVYLKTESVETDKSYDIRDSLATCSDSVSYDQTVQFSNNTLNTYTICDTKDSLKGNGIVPWRYQVHPLGVSCGEFIEVNVSGGYS